MSLVWTTEPPTEPGRYLCLDGEKEYAGYVENSNFSIRLYYWGITKSGEKVFFQVDMVGGTKWAGPIPEPTEAGE